MQRREILVLRCRSHRQPASAIDAIADDEIGSARADVAPFDQKRGESHWSQRTKRLTASAGWCGSTPTCPSPSTTDSMRTKVRQALLVVAVAAPSVVSTANDVEDTLSAGAFTVSTTDKVAYTQPGLALSERQRESFLRGRAGFNRPWVVFAVSTGDWGLGPTFVADSCGACHMRGGRGSPPETPDEPPVSVVVRLSVPGTDAHGGPRPHERYGDQLQNRALQGQRPELLFRSVPVPHEADIRIEWDEHTATLSDGTEVPLRRPRVHIEQLAFGELGADTITSLRVAPPVFGLGLLEAVPEDTFHELAAAQRQIGFAGRPNFVWNAIEQRMSLGRFGWKASQPSMRQQIASAAIADMGVTSNLFPKQNCPDVQTACLGEVPGNDPELSDAAWDDLEILALGLGVPARRNWSDENVQRGASLFERLQCAVCHTPTLRTAESFPRMPQLARQTIHPYTDLLLHDMGEGLADHRPEFAAGGRDWRTPPLWGLGLSRVVNGNTTMLHDGRARNATEAILWHGGEAAGSREGFAKMTAGEREALLAFLDAI